MFSLFLKWAVLSDDEMLTLLPIRAETEKTAADSFVRTLFNSSLFQDSLHSPSLPLYVYPWRQWHNVLLSSEVDPWCTPPKTLLMVQQKKKTLLNVLYWNVYKINITNGQALHGVPGKSMAYKWVCSSSCLAVYLPTLNPSLHAVIGSGYLCTEPPWPHEPWMCSRAKFFHCSLCSTNQTIIRINPKG